MTGRQRACCPLSPAPAAAGPDRGKTATSQYPAHARNDASVLHPGRPGEQMTGAMPTIGAAEAWQRHRQIRQRSNDGAFVTAREDPGARHRSRQGDAVDVPVRLLVHALVPRQPGPQPAGTARGTGLEKNSRLQRRLGLVRQRDAQRLRQCDQEQIGSGAIGRLSCVPDKAPRWQPAVRRHPASAGTGSHAVRQGRSPGECKPGETGQGDRQPCPAAQRPYCAQEPQAPTGSGTRGSGATRDSSFSSSALPQSGHVGCSAPMTRISNSVSHPVQ
jgi:hypothetical protein